MLEEVIRVVNQKKAAAYSNEQNVVLGVSLGGVIGKYALLDMQASSLPHGTRLLITYDSPLRGANIPIGIQSMIRFLKFNLDELAESQGTSAFSIPVLNDALNVLNSPAPQQLLLLQGKFGYTFQNNLPVWTYTVHNDPQVAFVAELDGLGSLAIRHVAIASGAANGTFLENDYSAGGLMYTMDLTGHICDEFFIKVLGWQVTGCANVDLEMAVRATGNNTPTEVFKGFFKFDKVGKMSGTIDNTLSVTLTTQPFDVMPGGNSSLGIGGLVGLDVGLKDLVVDYPSLTLTSSWPTILRPIHHTFVPTFSSLNAAMPGNAAAPQACGTPTLCSVPTEPHPNPIALRATPPTAPVPANEWNQEHIFLEARVGNLLKQELNALPSAYPHGQLPATLSTYYNLGDPTYRKVGSLSIETVSGKLSVNNQGRVGYATGNEPFSPLAMYHAYTECDAVINVESGSTLAVGGDQVGRDAVFHIEGSTVRIKSGGRLVVHGNSALSIENGSQLILDPGAILILRDDPDGPLVENGRPRIKIESGGTLVAKGDVSIQGDGYIELDPGNILDLPTDFTLSGSGKQYRFLRVNRLAEFKKTGGSLLLKDGLAEVGSYGRVLHQDGSLSRCLRTHWRPIEGATFPHTGLEVINGSIVQMQDCDLKDIRHGLRVTGASTSVSISNTHFGNTFGADIVNARFVSLHEVTAEGASFLFNGISHAAHLIRCRISGHMASVAPIQLTNVRIMTMSGGSIEMEYMEAYPCIDATSGGSNVTLRNGAKLLNGLYGIEMKGGLAGGPYAYAYGLVTLDCARILNSMSACIGGQDALLNIDADINSGGLRPNEFSLDPSNPWMTPGRYFDICYVKRDPGPAVRAQRNFWN
ncbi:MAG TPA: hypothetical protein PKD78_08150, partial [Saprospiraceae bacterium]|nr:hypothetical protein [Saprospiraceae bacterium]